MEPKVFTVQGNDVNGYMVVQLIDGDYEPITKRYSTYEEACRVLDDIRTDNAE